MDFWLSACKTISSVIAAAAARRAVISLIKSPAEGKRKKRPRHFVWASNIKAWFLIAPGRRTYRGEKKSISFIIPVQSGIMELRNYIGGRAKPKGFLHLSSSVTFSEAIVKPRAAEGRLRGQKEQKDRQGGNGCTCVIDVSNGWRFWT